MKSVQSLSSWLSTQINLSSCILRKLYFCVQGLTNLEIIAYNFDYDCAQK